MPRRFRIFAMMSVVVLVSACGGDTSADPDTSAGGPSSTSSAAPSRETTSTTKGTTTTVAEGFTVVSDDGDVTLEVPPGVLASDPSISITVLAPDEYPEPLSGAAQNPGTVVYRLSPDDLVFDVPARLTRRISASNFAFLPDSGLPLISLVVYREDTGFEQLDDTRIVRRGDDVFVSGTVTHFSTLVTVSEQIYLDAPIVEVARPDLDSGVAWTVVPGFFDSEGNELRPPETITATGISQENVVGFAGDGATLEGTCESTGKDMVELRWDAELDAETEGTFGLLSVPRISTLFHKEVILAREVELSCVEPRAPVMADLEVVVDHPGGLVNAQGEDFAGGASAILVRITDSGVPVIRVGVIQDVNENAMVDPDDLMTAPVLPTTTDEGPIYVIPIETYGDFLPYVLTKDVSGDIPIGPATIRVSDGMEFLRERLGDDGDDAVRIPLLGDIPFIARVFTEESTRMETTELVVLVTADLIGDDAEP